MKIANMVNALHALSTAAENILGDDTGMVEISPMANGRLFIGMSVAPGSKIIPAVAVANIEAKGFTIEEQDTANGNMVFMAQVVPTEKVPNAAAVVG